MRKHHEHATVTAVQVLMTAGPAAIAVGSLLVSRIIKATRRGER